MKVHRNNISEDYNKSKIAKESPLIRRTTLNSSPSSPPHSGNKSKNNMTSIKRNNNNNHGGGVVGNICSLFGCMNSIRMMVLVILCLQNSIFTLLRRYSLGVLKEGYSKYEVLVVGEIIKIGYCVLMIGNGLPKDKSVIDHAKYLFETSGKMFVLALIYGTMNVLSFVALRNIGAGIFTIFAQCKILTTATFSTILLGRKYSWNRWRALIALMLGVLLFSEPIWGDPNSFKSSKDGAMPIVGTIAVLTEVTLSGFASIYFEKVIKIDPVKLTIWERNFQLAAGSIPVYFLFIFYDYMFLGKPIGSGWSLSAILLSFLGAAGGLLVALSIKYGDSILKTLAVTGAIILSSLLDHLLLGGPLTSSMMIAGAQVIIAICNYTFDTTPVGESTTTTTTTGADNNNKASSPTSGGGGVQQLSKPLLNNNNRHNQFTRSDSGNLSLSSRGSSHRGGDEEDQLK